MFEKLLTAILALTAALEANTAAQKGAKKSTKSETAAADTPPAASPEAAAPEAPSAPTGPTVQSILAIAQKILDKGGLAKVKEVNAKLGIKKVSECPPEKLADLETALNKVLAEIDAV